MVIVSYLMRNISKMIQLFNMNPGRTKKFKKLNFFTISTSDTGPKLVTNISVLTSVTEPTKATKKQCYFSIKIRL